jgi:hypothetical protein
LFSNTSQSTPSIGINVITVLTINCRTIRDYANTYFSHTVQHHKAITRLDQKKMISAHVLKLTAMVSRHMDVWRNRYFLTLALGEGNRSA